MKTHASAAEGGTITPGLRRFLYLTSAIAGGAILVVEILGAKMLSPYYGTSHFVWTAQIGVTLVALAAGYYLGGRWVDRVPDLNRLFLCYLAAGVYLGAAVLFYEEVSYFFLRFRLAAGSVLASLFLYLVPLTLLAVTGPFLIRLMSPSMQGVGSQSGRLYAVSTLGSVAGTVLVGYVLIPFFPNSGIMAGTALVLLLLALVYYMNWGRPARRPAALVALLVGAALGVLGTARDLGRVYGEVRELARLNSNFGLMQVLESKRDGRRYYLNDYLNQNTWDPDRKQSLNLFTYMLHALARVYTPRLDTALCIGLGVGVVPSQLAREGVQVEVVEINPKVVPLAQAFFDFHPELMTIHLGDGRYFLNQGDSRYDTIILDAFLGDSSPSHLMTVEAFQIMRRRLQPEGTLVINSFGALGDGNDYFSASLQKTLKAVFKSVEFHPSPSGNLFVVASDREPLTPLRPYPLEAVPATLQQAVQISLTSTIQMLPSRGDVLRDDFNPLEFYDARNREAFRRELAVYLKGL